MADDWTHLASETEYETGWYTGGYDLFEQPDGTEKRYYWAELPPAVVVVAIVDDQLILVEQRRPILDETFIECPAGIVEEGESFTDAAIRELREETGFEANSASLLQRFYASTGVLRHERAIVFAEGLTPAERLLDSNEFITVRMVPVENAVEVAREPPANDATIEAVLLAREEGLL